MNSTLSKPESGTTETTSNANYRRPAYQVHNLEGAYEVHVHVPGCNKNGIDIHQEKDTLTIQATRENVTNGDWKLLHREFRDADFQLKLNLNVNIAADSISAKTEEGILKIHLPIAEEAKPRQISVD